MDLKVQIIEKSYEENEFYFKGHIYEISKDALEYIRKKTNARREYAVLFAFEKKENRYVLNGLIKVRYYAGILGESPYVHVTLRELRKKTEEPRRKNLKIFYAHTHMEDTPPSRVDIDSTKSFYKIQLIDGSFVFAKNKWYVLLVNEV